MGWLYTFLFSLESLQNVMTLVMSVFASVRASECVFPHVWLELQGEALAPVYCSWLKQLWPISSDSHASLLHLLMYVCGCVCLNVLVCVCVCVCVCVFACVHMWHFCLRAALCLVMQLLLTAVVCSCSLHLWELLHVCSHLCMRVRVCVCECVCEWVCVRVRALVNWEKRREEAEGWQVVCSLAHFNLFDTH